MWNFTMGSFGAVSYTHLDVYKRQVATVTSVPLRRTTATSGASASSAVMAPVVLPLRCV